MFHNISPAILKRMRYLEERDAQDRLDGTPRLQRLRQIPPETGRFLALLLAGAPDGAVLEVGTSAGYSTLWLSLACANRQRQIHTFELLPEKTAVAHETFALAQVEDVVQLIAGNALNHLPAYEQVGFCFLDAEKEVYEACYDLIVPRLIPGGWLVADNAINHQALLQPMLDKALQDERVDTLIVPIGNGLLLCRKIEG